MKKILDSFCLFTQSIEWSWLAFNLEAAMIIGVNVLLLAVGALSSPLHQDKNSAHPTHSWYLSRPLRPVVVYFFMPGTFCLQKNAKYLPILPPFGQFWLFFCKFTDYFVYFLQAWIMWWCSKIDKYQVWLHHCSGTSSIMFGDCSPNFTSAKIPIANR